MKTSTIKGYCFLVSGNHYCRFSELLRQIHSILRNLSSVIKKYFGSSQPFGILTIGLRIQSSPFIQPSCYFISSLFHIYETHTEHKLPPAILYCGNSDLRFSPIWDDSGQWLFRSSRKHTLSSVRTVYSYYSWYCHTRWYRLKYFEIFK